MPTIRVTFDVEVDKVPDSHDQKWAPMDDFLVEMEDLVLSEGFSRYAEFKRRWPSVRLVCHSTKAVSVKEGE